MVNVQIEDVVSKYYEQFKALLTVIEQKYPEQTITPSSKIEDIMYRAGQRSVLHHFRQVVEQVEENAKVINLD